MNHAEVSGLLCVGMHETDGGEESFVAEYPKMDQDTSHERTKFDVVMATSAIYTDHINTNACLDEYHMSGDQPVEEIRFGSTQPFELQSEGMVADSEEESMPSSPDTSSTSNYDMPGYMGQNLQHIYNSYDELVDKQGPVVLSPAFITCDETVHLEPHLTFSLDGIKIEYLDLDSFEDDKLVALQWEMSNIISIDCKWTQSVGSALITLIAGSEAERGIPDPIRVQFCLDDSQWPRRQQKIWDLGPRYQEIWKDIPSDDFTSENWSIEPCLFFPRQYFSSAEDFEDVIYPQGDPDAVSISKRDVELLLPETFVNDTIIDFYIKYLSTRIEATEKCRYHFFNSFFFRKLAGLDKDQGRAPEGREAFLRVRKWTRKISVFDKDFLFIPVNFNLHWSLIVICYPGEVATFEDGDIKLSAKVPCILHMDSLKGSHTELKDIIQSYLWEEWKERHPESASDNSDKFLNLRFVSLELPQQDNSYDCGLFLLHYVELFLTDAPSNFNPLKIDVFSGFLSDDWFAPPEASLKRSVVRKLIHELVTGSFQNHPKLVCGGEQLDERHQRCSNAEQEPTREFHAQICSAGEPETVCTVGDGTHEIQPSKSRSNDSKEKELPTSECMLDTGRAPIVDVQNLLELEVCTPDKDTVVCLLSQDEKNEPLASNSQLNMRSYAPEDEVFKESNRVVTDEENEKSLFLSLDNNQKIRSQAEVEVQDIMVSTSCSISEIFAQEITSKEQSSKKSVEVGDECFGPCQGMDYVMTFDSSKDDDGPSPQRMTAEEDCGDPHEGINSVKLVEINKNVVDNAIIEDVKSISRTEDNVNHGELYVSLQLPEGNADNGMTGASTASSDLKEENIDKVVAGHSAEESNINANGSSELKIGNISSGTGVSTASSDLKEENIDKIGAGDCVHESGINAKDSYELKVRNTDNGITGSSTISSDLNEGNTDEIIAGDCINKTNLNAAADEGADKYLAKDSALPCEEDATCTDGVILSLEPCSMKNETVSKNTTSDAKMPLVGGTCELVARPCTPKNEMSESTSFDGKRPAADGTCEENELVIPGDAKTEQRYKRRKVLALEKQRSFSEDLKIGNAGSGIAGVITASSDLKEENIDKVVAGDCVHESGINAKDSSELKVRKIDNGITGSSTVSSDLNEGNTDEITAGDCINKTNLNAAADEDADKYLAKDSALPCEEDVTCTDVMILSLEPCNMKNETVSKNTTSDAKIPLAGGTCELVGRPCTPKNEMSESTSFDGKRPASDGTCEENELVIPGDAKTERCYKRRKVLALEKQRSFSGANSTD